MNNGFWVTNRSKAGCSIYGINKFEVRESKNSLVGWSSVKFNKLMLKLPRRKTCLFCSDNLSERMLRLKSVFITVELLLKSVYY